MMLKAEKGREGGREGGRGGEKMCVREEGRVPIILARCRHERKGDVKNERRDGRKKGGRGGGREGGLSSYRYRRCRRG
jgi:hypothetical protein